MGFGGRPKSAKFVYRGGFKIPRELTPMPSVDSIGGATFPAQGASSVVAATSSSLEAYAASGDRARRGTGRGKDASTVALKLSGIISSSRMGVGSLSDRDGGGSIGGEDDDGGRRGGRGLRRARPSTAGATVGRRDSSYFCSSPAGGGVERGKIEIDLSHAVRLRQKEERGLLPARSAILGPLSGKGADGSSSPHVNLEPTVAAAAARAPAENGGG